MCSYQVYRLLFFLKFNQKLLNLQIDYKIEEKKIKEEEVINSIKKKKGEELERENMIYALYNDPEKLRETEIDLDLTLENEVKINEE